MSDYLSALASIAESRIQEAMEKGELDNLPGQGKPLVFEDISHVPEDLRMAYKLLKNAGYLPPELERRKEIGNLADLLDNCPSEQEKARCMRKLRYLLNKANLFHSSASLASSDEYYEKILARLERHESSIKNAP